MKPLVPAEAEFSVHIVFGHSFEITTICRPSLSTG